MTRHKLLGSAAVLIVSLSSVSGCRRHAAAAKADSLVAAYDVEPDWTDPQKIAPLGYQQAQGKRVFYDKCVWCHADATPAGPSNRTNLMPQPPLLTDGSVMNPHA